MGKVLTIAILVLGGLNISAQEMAPLKTGDVRVLFERSLGTFQELITKSENLSEEERVRMSQQIENDAELMRENIDSVVDAANVLGERTFVAGILVTYSGEYNFPAMVNKGALVPAAEAGVAVFLQRNSYLADALRASTVVLGKVEGKVAPRGQLDKKVERGFQLRLLLKNFGDERAVASLNDFSGLYEGITGEMGLFNRRGSGEVYTKLETCTNFNPFACQVYVISVWASKNPEVQTKPAEMGVGGLYLNFPHDNNGRGTSLN